VHTVSVSGLKPNPEGGLLQAPGARDALATALFWDGELSLVRSAHAAKPPSGSRPPPPPPLIPAGGKLGELPGLKGKQLQQHLAQALGGYERDLEEISKPIDN
jgi:hypothetical protein